MWVEPTSETVYFIRYISGNTHVQHNYSVVLENCVKYLHPNSNNTLPSIVDIVKASTDYDNLINLIMSTHDFTFILILLIHCQNSKNTLEDFAYYLLRWSNQHKVIACSFSVLRIQ